MDIKLIKHPSNTQAEYKFIKEHLKEYNSIHEYLYSDDVTPSEFTTISFSNIIKGVIFSDYLLNDCENIVIINLIDNTHQIKLGTKHNQFNILNEVNKAVDNYIKLKQVTTQSKLTN